MPLSMFNLWCSYAVVGCIEPSHKLSCQPGNTAGDCVCKVVIKLVTNVMIVQTAQGHGDAVNDIAVHPTKPALFVTASRVSITGFQFLLSSHSVTVA